MRSPMRMSISSRTAGRYTHHENALGDLEYDARQQRRVRVEDERTPNPRLRRHAPARHRTAPDGDYASFLA